MRIAYIGNFRPEFSTENDVAKSLRALGHQVTEWQEDRPLVADWDPRQDLVLWSHTHGWDQVSWPDIASFCAPKGVPTVAFTLDLFRGLARHDPAYVETHPWFRCKYFFQPDSPDWLRARGVNAYFSPPAILESSCYVSPLDPKHEAYGKVVFVGSRTYHPEWGFRPALIDWLEKTYGQDFLLYEHSSGLRGDRLNQVYANAAVVVGDSCFASPDSPYTSDRLFESLGRGAALLYPNIHWESFPGVRAFLECNGGTYVPGCTDELEWKIGILLEDWRQWHGDPSLGGDGNAEYVDPLRYEAAQFVQTYHSYAVRLRSILETVAREEGR